MPWYRILAVPSAAQVSSSEWDFVAVLPAALSAKQWRRPFVVGWLSRGGGAPLELITNAGPLVFPGGPDELTAETGPSAARGPAYSLAAGDRAFTDTGGCACTRTGARAFACADFGHRPDVISPANRHALPERRPRNADH